MDIEAFREFCLGLKGTTEDMKWGDNLCFMIEEKIYVMTALERGNLSFKCNPDDFDALVARHGIQQAAHLARRQWVSLDNLEVMPDAELKNKIADSRKLVLSKLTKKLQEKYR